MGKRRNNLGKSKYKVKNKLKSKSFKNSLRVRKRRPFHKIRKSHREKRNLNKKLNRRFNNLENLKYKRCNKHQLQVKKVDKSLGRIPVERVRSKRNDLMLKIYFISLLLFC